MYLHAFAVSMLRRASWRARMAWAVAACLAADIVCAQSVEYDVASESERLAKEGDHFALPDVSDQSLQEVNIEPEHQSYQVKIGRALLPTDCTTWTTRRSTGAPWAAGGRM